MAAVWFGVCSQSAVSQEGILGFEVLKVRGGRCWERCGIWGSGGGLVSPGKIHWDLG